jgi:hypothetical protein
LQEDKSAPDIFILSKSFQSVNGFREVWQHVYVATVELKHYFLSLKQNCIKSMVLWVATEVYRAFLPTVGGLLPNYTALQP